jgi:uncharacterized protein (DUF305 family)
MSEPRIVIVGFPSAQILDITGPLEVFSTASRFLQIPRNNSPGMPGMDHRRGASSNPSATVQGKFNAAEQMIEHHQGAIEMAQDELDEGADRDVLALAQRIITSQTAEIATMQKLLTQL